MISTRTTQPKPSPGQELFLNQNLAYQALAMLTQLLRRGSLTFQAGFCNLAIGQLAPLPVRPLETGSYATIN